MKNKNTPPLFLNSDPDSFARNTFLHRIFDILDHTVRAHEPRPDLRFRTDRLREEIRSGRVAGPFDGEPVDLSLFDRRELSVWKSLFARYRHGSWLDMGFYEAEAAFYLKLLVAFGYYDADSPRLLEDPFKPIKRGETAITTRENGAALELARILAGGGEEKDLAGRLLQASLWGNQIDFSLRSIVERERKAGARLSAGHGRDRLLIDHSDAAIDALARARRVDFILDNAGTELVCDLFLANLLLTRFGVRRVHMHHKKRPIYVSDALIDDTHDTLEHLLQGEEPIGDVAGSVRDLLESDRLVLKDHHFWNGPLTFPFLPKRLRRDLSRSDLVIVKGDANYRRLLHDRRWPVDTPMEKITRYFPAPCVAVRTFKSEMVVDMDEGSVARLSAEDPHWSVNGTRGLIRYVEA